jgi:hypothetical protein
MLAADSHIERVAIGSPSMVYSASSLQRIDGREE